MHQREGDVQEPAGVRMLKGFAACSEAASKAALIVMATLIVHGNALAEGQLHCPATGTQLSFSDGGAIESLGEVSDSICRFKNRQTSATYERILGAFVPTAAIIKTNMQKIRSLIPLKVGKRVTFETSGASNLGGDGAWQYTLLIEKAETIVTPAGTLATFVLLYQEQTFGSGGKWERRYWYSPEVGHVVKFEFKTIHGSPPKPYPSNWTLTEVRAPGETPQTASRTELPSGVRAESPGSNSIDIPLRKQGGVLVVPVTINGTLTLNFVLDSGASDVSIPADVVMTLMRTGTITPSDFLGSQTYRLADGSTVPSQTFRIRSLKIGDSQLENVTGSVASVK